MWMQRKKSTMRLGKKMQSTKNRIHEKQSSLKNKKVKKVQLKRNLKELANRIRDFFRAIYWILVIVFLIFWVIFTPLPKEYK